MTTTDIDVIPAGEIRVKLLGKYKPGRDGEGWMRMFPDGQPKWRNCRFIFDRDCRDYDWLVVYDDLPSLAGERHPLWEEKLACPAANTLLMTTEPSTIKIYGADFVRQFRWILTSQEAWAVANHPGRLFEQPALTWFYAFSSPRGDYDTLVRNVPLNKTRDVSTVCSSKRQGNTLHRRRYDFTQELKAHLPELEIFGRGVRPIDDKADALDAYRYHIAIENFSGPHHWTEKLADAFLGACMPFYYGCTNVAEYFPEESFVPIDINDAARTADLIRKAIKDKAYEKNLSAILESRRLVLEQYGPVATICRIINQHSREASATSPSLPVLIKSRRRLNRSVLGGIRYGMEKQLARFIQLKSVR